MNFASSVSLLSLLFTNGIVSTSTTQHSRFDITKILNDTIVETLLETIEYDTPMSLADKIKYCRSTYEIENTPKLEPFVGDKIYLHNIEVRAIAYNKPTQCANYIIYYDYDKNTQGLFGDKMTFKIYGYIGIEPKNTYVGFRATLGYQNIKIGMTKDGDKLKLRVVGDIVRNRVRLQYWDSDNTTNNTLTSGKPYNLLLEDLIKEIDPLSKNRIPHIVRKTLTNRTKSFMPSILLDNMNHNEKFLNAMNASFHLQPKQKIMSQYSDLLDNEQRYYFSIANFSFVDLNLNTMKLRGLWNYEKFLVKPFKCQSENYSISVLRLNNISGSVHWDHGYKNVAALEVYFNAGGIEFQYNQKEKSVTVHMVNCSVTKIRPKQIKACDLSILSQNLDSLIEITIASKILPSLRIHTKRGLEKNLTNVRDELVNWLLKTFPETSEHQSAADHKTTNKLHHLSASSNDIKIRSTSVSSDNNPVETTIPFNNTVAEWTPNPFNETSTKSKSIKNNTITEEESNPETYDYQISFPNVTIKLVSANLRTYEQLQCQIFNNKFTRQINAVMVGTLYVNKESNNSSIALNFHCEFDSMNFSIIEPNDSDKNDTCEFQISNNQDIKVELPQSKNITETKESAEMKRKIEKTLLSMVTQRISKNLKLLACFPVNVCTQSVKMIDHYVLGFVDNVLKKCSLRRSKTTIT